MPVTFKTPGVHIIEVTPAGPIEGVGTSTAAFIGPYVAGPMRKPTLIAGWSQFVDTFGKEVEIDGRLERSPYSAFPKRLYSPIAVRGFFDNGGQTAYIVRVGTGAQSSLELEDRADEPAFSGTPAPTPGPSLIARGTALRVVAKKEGEDGDLISVQVNDANLRTTTLAQASATIISAAEDSNVILVDDSSEFRAGDIVEFGLPPSPTPGPTPAPGTSPGPLFRAKVTRIRQNDSENRVTLDSNLTEDYTGGTVYIPNLRIGDRTFRVLDARDIERGSIIRINQSGSAGEDAEVANVILLPPEDSTRQGLITLKTGLNNAYSLQAGAALVDVQTLEFELIIRGPGGAEETFSGLSMNPEHTRYFDSIVNSLLVDVVLPSDPSLAPAPRNMPRVIGQTNLDGGAEDDVTQLEAGHFREGLDTLEQIDDVNILCAPDAADTADVQAAVQSDLIAHCTKMKDRFAILDPVDVTPDGEALAAKAPLDDTGVIAQRMSVASSDGRAALYYPRIQIQNPDPGGRGQIAVPPSGHIAGLYAAVDSNRGVHKAPANVTIQGALGLALKDDRRITDAEQGELNIKGINVIRMFPLQGVVVWGARTISDLTAWRYISTRRLFLFVEESLQEGTRWAVFEPNTPALWGKLRRTITDFLTRVWRDGALFGSTPEDAFFVKVDEELNPDPVRALGQLYIEVGLRIAFPAEFIIIHIGQKVGGADVTELA